MPGSQRLLLQAVGSGLSILRPRQKGRLHWDVTEGEEVECIGSVFAFTVSLIPVYVCTVCVHR